MKSKILVAYATTHGSTQEIAEEIGKVLRESGQTVDVLPVRNVRSLDEYSAVVLGAPFYMYNMHGDARRFLARQQKALSAGLPAAFFSGGPMGKGDEQEWQGVRDQMNKELARYPWFKPVSTLVVGGRFDPDHLRFPWKLIPAMSKIPAADLRDWEAIHNWASSLLALLARAPQVDPAV